MKLYYNPQLDLLGIGDTGLEWIVVAKLVYILSKLNHTTTTALDYGDPMPYVEHETALPFSTDWEEIGDL